MNLGRQETTFYESTYLNVTQNSSSLDETNCRNLLKKGVRDPSLRDQVWNLVMEDNQRGTITKDDFFKLLKCIAAVQQGYGIDKISFNELPELALPVLSKKKKGKKNARASVVEPTEDNKQAVSLEELPERSNTEEPKNKDETVASKEDDDLHKDMFAAFSRSPAVMASENDNQELAQRASINTELVAPNVQKLEEFALDLELPPEYKLKASQTVEEKQSPLTSDSKSQRASTITSPRSADTMKRRESIIQKRREEQRRSERKSEPLLPECLDDVVVPDFEENARIVDSKDIRNPFRDTNNLKNDVSGDHISEISTQQETNKSDNFEEIQDTSSFLKYNEYFEQSQKIKINIDRTVTYSSGFLGYGTYVAYVIKSKYLETDISFEIERRYSDFDWLNCYFRSCPQYRGLTFPALPEKKTIGNMEPVFVQQRKVELEKYLKEISRHPVLSKDMILRGFLGEKNREEFQAMKDRNPVNGIALNLTLPNWDWEKMKDAFEYAFANVKVKLKKESLPSEWKEANERIGEVLKVDNTVETILINLQKKQESLKALQKMNSNLNVSHMKVMNRADNESYYAIGSLSSLFVAKTAHAYEDLFVVDDLIKEVRVFKARLDSFKQGYALLVSTLEGIGTNKELFKNKQAKLFEYRAEGNVHNMTTISKEISEIEKKIISMEKEVIIIRDNLNSETTTVMQEFEVVLPYVLDGFYGKQREQSKKIADSWKNVALQYNIDKNTTAI